MEEAKERTTKIFDAVYNTFKNGYENTSSKIYSSVKICFFSHSYLSLMRNGRENFISWREEQYDKMEKMESQEKGDTYESIVTESFR